MRRWSRSTPPTSRSRARSSASSAASPRASMAPAAPLTARDLNRATLARQGLLDPIAANAASAVGRVVSLQAQHPEWPPVALAARAADRSAADLAAALADRSVV